MLNGCGIKGKSGQVVVRVLPKEERGMIKIVISPKWCSML